MENPQTATHGTVESKIARLTEIRKTFEDPEKEITIDESALLLDESAKLYSEIHDALSGMLLKVDEVRRKLDETSETQ